MSNLDLVKMFWREINKVYNDEYVGKIKLFYGGAIDYTLERIEEKLKEAMRDE